MKKVIASFMAAGMVFVLSSSLQAATVKIDVYPSDVPPDGESEPRVNFGDAPTGYGPDSWQGPATGKSNWHARYIADGNALSALFPEDAASMTIADLAEISYFTKRPAGTEAGRDWWVQIYTRPSGSGDKSSWYHDRFINNYNDHANIGDWTEYSTDGGEMTFASNGWGVIGESTLSELIAVAGDQQVEMISVQTNSGWDGFDGYIDGLEITLTNGNVGQVNFVPEPGTLTLMGVFGLLGMVAMRRRGR